MVTVVFDNVELVRSIMALLSDVLRDNDEMLIDGDLVLIPNLTMWNPY